MNVQITEETHQLLKEYCDEHGYKMSFIVDKIIKNYIQPLHILAETKEKTKTKRNK